MKVYADLVDTPVAKMLVVVDEEGALTHLDFVARRSLEELTGRVETGGRTITWDAGRCSAVREEIEEYFRGERTAFDVALAFEGTDFQKRVWRALCDIPFGETLSYGELAERIGAPGSSRAVGAANGQNPISLIVPCHRVIGADGSLTGYGGGLPTKRALLDFERGQRSFVTS